MRPVKNGWLLVVLLSCLFVSAAYSAPLRATLSLDGEWDFATDPEGVGETEKWYLPDATLPAMPLEGYAPEAKGRIQVPGIWDNQGYGTETDTLRHNMPGKGWYRRQVQVPAVWNGQRIFLCIGGIHRYSKVWVNGQYLGEHIGFLSTFEYDLTDLAKPGEAIQISIQVDSKQRWEVDAMYGAGNLADFMMTEWGGDLGARQIGGTRRCLAERVVRSDQCGGVTLFGQCGLQRAAWSCG